MPILDQGADIFDGVETTFTSVVPSSQDSRFSERLAGIFQDSGKIVAAMQADAYKNALQMTLKSAFSSRVSGGIRTPWLHEISWQSEGGVGRGLFADFLFNATTDAGDPKNPAPGSMLGQAANVGLVLAQNALSAVPVVGQILGAAISMGVFIRRLSAMDDEVITRTVPWRAYQPDSDDGFVAAITKQVAP